MNSQQFFISLDSLVELSNKLNSSRNIQFIVNTVILSLMGKLGYLRGGAFFVDDNANVCEEIVIKGNLNRENLKVLLRKFSSLEFDEKKYLTNFLDGNLVILIKNFNQKNLLLVLDARFKKCSLTNEEQRYLTLVLNMAVNALELAYNYEILFRTKIELERRNQLLSTLFEINKDFSSSLTIEQILNHLRYRILGQLLVNKFAVYYYDNGRPVELISTFDVSIKEDDLEILFSFDKIQIVNEELNNQNLPLSILNNQVKIISPMKYQNSTRGILLLGKKYNNQPFANEDLHFIEAFGNIVILSIENARLIEEEISKKQLEKELQLALEIQSNLLPKNFPILQNLEVYGFTVPSKIVGGDYFDILNYSESLIYVAIADVAGKGIPASLLMANVQSALHLLVKLDLNLVDIVNNINSIIYRNTTADIFITFFLGKLDLNNFEFSFVNAGHNPPLLYKKQSKNFISLTNGTLFLGFLESPLDIEVGKVNLEKGDLLFLYTDGVVECEDSNGIEFGIANLKTFIKNNYYRNSKEFCELLYEEILRHCGSAQMKDDISCVALKIK